MRRMVHPIAPGHITPRNEAQAAVFRKSGWEFEPDDHQESPAPAGDDDTTEAGGDLPTDSEKE